MGATSLDEGQLLQEFVKVERAEEEIRIFVRQISWNEPAESVSVWVVAKNLHPDATQVEVENAARAILEDEQYFRFCWECAARIPVGQMHDDSICQGCASTNHGVVY